MLIDSIFKGVVCIVGFVCISILSFGQSTFKAVIRDKDSGRPLPGATAVIMDTSLGATANETGTLEIRNIPDGNYRIEFAFVGFRKKIIPVTLPDSSDQTFKIFLEGSHEELEEVVISSTRSTRTIADAPTRVEFIAGEELDEKANMKPGDIRMLLSESTGIQTQQTSATSANASIRIQGLDGRYTQILKDGFPMYAGFSGGLGLLQTPPLDLKQVEVIKGSTSTLYGGGAIAGLVNLISRVPTEERELRFFLNGTSALGLDLSGFYSQKLNKRVGVTVFAARNTSEAYDPSDIGLTAIPKYERYTINPNLYVDFTNKTSMNVGFNFVTEDRIGGDLKFINGDGNGTNTYFEENNSKRFSTKLALSHKISERRSLNFKSSLNHFDRIIKIPDYTFKGVQNSTYTEFNYIFNNEKSEWIAGLNLLTDDFAEQQHTDIPLRDYKQITIGAFVQNNVTLSEKVNLETGLRGDYVVDFGFALLPRVSLLYKVSPSVSTRIGGGFGYKAPTIFTEDSERIQYQNVLPISAAIHKLEKSYGVNWDLNYATELTEDITLNINHLFFYTYLENPLVLTTSGQALEFDNLNGYMDSKGTETNVKLEYKDFKLFIGYTFTDARLHSGGTSVQNPLTAKHRLNNVLMYEVEEQWKIGLEAYYFSRQRLSDNTFGKEYWVCGFMVEKIWEHFSLFINFENFLDTRQTRFDSIYTGSISNPTFRDIYAPVDGFVINGGLKLNL